MTGAPIRVLLADDEPHYRETLRLLLSTEPALSVVAEAGSGRQACAAVRRLRAAGSDVDVAVLDVRMPDLDGIAATGWITAQPNPPLVLILTTFDLDDAVYAALQAGASGFLLKDAPPARLLDAVRTVAAGEALLAPSVTRRLIGRFRQQAPNRDLTGLTPREREVLVLITAGRSNTEIERLLRLSRHTVKTHIGHLKTKLAARDRAQLVIAGYEAGLDGER